MRAVQDNREHTRAAYQRLLEEGLLGRGAIEHVEQIDSGDGQDFAARAVCTFRVTVYLDRMQPYEATCRQAIPVGSLRALCCGRPLVAVRVDPGDHACVVLDLAATPPAVTLAESDWLQTAERIFHEGRSAQAVVVDSLPAGLTTADGVEVYSLVLTVRLPDQAPYHCHVALPVPAGSVGLIGPEATLPAWVANDNDGAVAIDWHAAALAHVGLHEIEPVGEAKAGAGYAA